MKIASIVGARPQFIKLGPLSKRIRAQFDEIIIHTGQHFDKEMSAFIFKDLELPEPDYNLGVNGGPQGEQTARMLVEIEKVILKIKPDVILVFGDTNSTLAGAMVGSKLCIKTIHIESGLRSFNRIMPEEINRIIADHASDLLFAPTETAMLNLKNEGLSDISLLTGDIMTDALFEALPAADSASGILEKLRVSRGKYYILTLHRPYNVDNPALLYKMLNELQSLEREIIFPVHPRTKKIIEKEKFKLNEKIIFINPLGYMDFLKLQKDSFMIITDSGGIQKEAYILKKPCVTLRTETEWVETVAAGWNLLVNPQETNIAERINSFTPPMNHPLLFGNNVAEKMVEIIKEACIN